MRILIVIRKLNGGGAERAASVLLNALAKMDGVNVAALVYNISSLDYYLSPNVLLLRPLGKYDESLGTSFSRKLKRIAGINKACVSFKPDVIIPFLNDALIESFFCSGKYGIPIIATVRNKPKYYNFLEKELVRSIFTRVHGVCFQSEAQKEWFKNWKIKKSFILVNPVDESFFHKNKISERISTIINVGRYVEQKNQLMLIDVMADIHKLYPEMVLEIYGEGPLNDELENRIHELGASDYVRLCGIVSHLEKIYVNRNCMFVLNSLYEGMPNALAEAMAAGIPCISADCPTGPRELLGDGRGILVGVNDKKELLEAIVSLVENTELARDYGEKAYEYAVNNLTAEKVAKDLISSLGDIIQGK